MSTYFRDSLAETTFLRTYAKFLPDQNKREHWNDTIDRVVNHMTTVVPLSGEDEREIHGAMLRQEVLPSMRYMQFAGPAVDRNNLTIYNCSYLGINSLDSFHDAMYLLMCGVGVGFSAERKFVSHLPDHKVTNGDDIHFVISDDKESWADALRKGMTQWLNGCDITYDFSLIRPEGVRLKTMGGRASGPAPLKELLDYTREQLYVKKLPWTSLLVLRIMCKIGKIVVSGSTRRSALICISDLDDKEMANAKSGEYWKTDPHFNQVNISAAYDSIPNEEQFVYEWDCLVKSNSGERGIFNRYNAIHTMPVERKIKMSTFMFSCCNASGTFRNGDFAFHGGLDLMSKNFENITSIEGKPGFVIKEKSMYSVYTFKDDVNKLGTNPCGEIILRDRGLCNLCSVICRPSDTVEDLRRKVRIGAIIGTLQSTLTKFNHVSEEFRRNCEDERLLGVSLTGQIECPALWQPGVLSMLREEARSTNEIYARTWGINKSLAVTAVKPDGTVSIIVSATHGLHAAYSQYYIRRLRIGSNDPIAHFLIEKGVPFFPENNYTMENTPVYVFEFVIKAPEKALTRNEQDEFMALERWMRLKKEYTDHNPSVTIDVRKNMWDVVGDWIYERFRDVGGLSFLPYSDSWYPLKPYDAISEEEYMERLSKFPVINFSEFIEYEDNTNPKETSACSGAQCSRV